MPESISSCECPSFTHEPCSCDCHQIPCQRFERFVEFQAVKISCKKSPCPLCGHSHLSAEALRVGKTISFSQVLSYFLPKRTHRIVPAVEPDLQNWICPDCQECTNAIKQDPRLLWNPLGTIGMKRRSLRKRLNDFIESPGLLIGWFYAFVTCVAVLTSIIKTIPDNTAATSSVTMNFSNWAIYFFTAELVLRFVSTEPLWAFFKKPLNWLDMAGVLPFYMRLSSPLAEQRAQLLRLLRPTFALLKLSRGFRNSRILLRVANMAIPALATPVFSLIILAVFIGCFFAYWEPAINGSIFNGTWLGYYTITTVGYGEAPITVGGKLFDTCFMLLGVIYLAVPLGVIGTEFNLVWRYRDIFLVIEDTKKRLQLFGLPPDDLEMVFRVFDLKIDNHIDFQEFIVTLHKIGIATTFTRSRTHAMFELLGARNSRSRVSVHSFAKSMRIGRLFPQTICYKILCKTAHLNQ